MGGVWKQATMDHGFVEFLPHEKYLASFPGSHAPEREHWSYAGVESLVFHVKSAKGREKVGREDLIVCGRTRDQNRKKSEGSGQLTTRI